MKSRKYYDRMRYGLNKKQVRDRMKRWRSIPENKEKEKLRRKIAYAENKNGLRDKMDEYQKKHPEKYRKVYLKRKQRKKDDVEYKKKQDQYGYNWKKQHKDSVNVGSRRREKKQRDSLTDRYIKRQLRNTNQILNPSPEIIEVKRLLILLKRKIREREKVGE